MAYDVNSGSATLQADASDEIPIYDQNGTKAGAIETYLYAPLATVTPTEIDSGGSIPIADGPGIYNVTFSGQNIVTLPPLSTMGYREQIILRYAYANDNDEFSARSHTDDGNLYIYNLVRWSDINVYYELTLRPDGAGSWGVTDGSSDSSKTEITLE